jgi:hypothetical protein
MKESQQESQKLTGDGGTETPRTEEALRKFRDWHDKGNLGRPSHRKEPPSGWKFASQLERELSSLSRELEGVRKDAERYRFLREQAESAEGMTADGLDVGINWHRFTWKPIGPWPDAFDKAVDAAIDSALRE